MEYIDFGPIHARINDPKFSWEGSGTTPPPARISGLMTWTAAQALREFVGSPDERQTIGDATGVFDQITFVGDAILEPLNGWYVMTSLTLDASVEWSLNGASGPVPFTLEAAYVGESP